MSAACGFGSRVWVVGRAGVAAVLCALMVNQPALGEAAAKAPVAARTGQMQGDARVLHALNRLTFGPRPGDVAAVEAMGLNKWFEMQLNPGSIIDAKLDAITGEYPAMGLPVAELQRRYPGPQRIKQMIDGKEPLPTDSMARAMVEDQIAFYKMGKAKQAQEAKAAAGDSGAGTAGGDSMQAASAQAGSVGKAGNKQKQINAGFDAIMSEDGPDAKMALLAKSEIAPEGMTGDLDARGAGYSRADVARILGLPAEQRMAAILAMPVKDLVRFRGSLKAEDMEQLTEGMIPQEKEMLLALPGSLRMVALEAMESRLMRDVYSERQLEAVMTDFWLNHFNVYLRKNQNEPYLIPSYERKTIRPLALGKFEDLLVATAQSPAMLEYLDNFRSVGPNSVQARRLEQAKMRFPNAPLVKQASAGLNENYGRELMELHTLGVNGGYTQADVTNVAKVFTGWGVDRPQQGGGFAFEEKRHEPGSKVVLGRTIPEGGEREGLEVLHTLATSPATAHFICGKLAVRFVSDNPPAALVDRMAASFLKSDGDIKTVLRTMFNSPEFWAAGAERAKVKTPEEFVVSAVRASGAEVVDAQALVQSLDKLGMPLYGMQTPNGYSWTQEGWVGTGALVSRMNFALVLSGGRMPGVKTEWTRVLGEGTAGVKPASYGVGDGAAGKERRLEMVLLGVPASERTRATVLGQSGNGAVMEQAETQFDLRGGGGKGNYGGRGLGQVKGAGTDDPQAGVMGGLLLGSPEFQRR